MPGLRCLYLLLLLVFFSCKKDKEKETDSSGIYHKSVCKAEEGIRLFTHSGEITDAVTINRWKEMLGFGLFSKELIENEFFLDRNYYTDTIKIIDPFSAILRHGVTWGFQYANFSINRHQTNLTFNSVSPMTLELDDDPAADPRNGFFTFPPEYRNKRPSPNGKYFYDVTIRYFAEIEGMELVMPMMAFAYKQTFPDGHYSINTSVGINNLLDAEGVAGMPINDSFAVQTFRITYVK